MKLLCVIDSLGSGGAQRQLVGLAIGFKENGYDVSFLVYHNENFFKELLVNENIQVVAVIEPSYFKRLFKIRRYIRRGNYDAVLSFLEGANFICEFAGLPWRNWKLVVGERSSNPNILKSFKLRFYRWFHLLADFVVSNSHENLGMVRKINPLLPARKCKVIYNMVDFDVWKPAADYKPYKNGKINLLVAASHQYLKNAKGLIEAFRSLGEKDKLRIKIDWYGDEQPNNSFQEAKALVLNYQLGYVFSFHKATQNIIQKMQYADVIGLFSFYEGLPNVVCEGMSLGKPVISSAISDVPNLLDNDKLLFNPLSVNDITSALTYILSLKKEELLLIGEKNKTFSQNLFQKKTIIKSYLDLLN